MEFLGAELVKNIQAKLIDDYGGSHGLRDEGLLESAVHRARNKAMYEDESTVAAVAASMSYGLIKNHAFLDGNKRIGLAALLVFLDANGYSLNASSEDAEHMVLQTASSKITEDELTAWVEKSVTALPR